MKILGKYNLLTRNLLFIFCIAIIAFISYYEFIYRTSLNEYLGIDSKSITRIFIMSRNLADDQKSEWTYTDQSNIKSYLQNVNSLIVKRKIVKEQLLRMGLPIPHNSSSTSDKIVNIFMDDMKGNKIGLTVYLGRSISVSVLNTSNLTVERYEFEIVNDVEDDVLAITN